MAAPMVIIHFTTCLELVHELVPRQSETEPDRYHYQIAVCEQISQVKYAGSLPSSVY